MVVLIIENAPASLRGELSRWMIEPRAGVFVGTISALVRDKLWEHVARAGIDGGATMLYTSNTEQKFAVRSFGSTSRQIVEFEGLVLVQRRDPSSKRKASQQPKTEV